ncbi:Permease, cytosine/purines, uracil, thiamine, allantoin [Penicillium griseofulvum]|uniref:Permease, cytosine/purines, uracil, thiamine, allantoin n=1 Tax=Penicillium patulum TaxID=5078 RepID=A0A135LBP7_PENPA|nr:Permease, cytosine/purines, uracil, thiamine, allantoin [Penicillium griseofulvum]KXG46411.1 Permease, cytosine/purines, uracil, thiamine, allantoin [Penicillium griseofulvum]
MKTDVEKAHSSPTIESLSFNLDKSASNSSSNDTDLKPEPVQTRWQRWIASMKNVESRGIEPIPIENREQITPSTILHMLLMWFSMTLATNNIVVGSMGTLVLGLSFRDAALCAVFGCLAGNCTVGFISIWGPRSGNRTLIVARYFMGYYPSKACIILNLFTNIGYSMVNSVVGGQILSVVSGGHLSVIVGIIIVAVSSWAMAIFGMKIFQLYERVAWLPQLLVICVMIGSAGPHFDFNIQTPMSTENLTAKRLTFFSLALSIALAWAPLAADYYVYLPPQMKSSRTFLATVFAATSGMSVVLLMGIGLGTVIASSVHSATKHAATPGGVLMVAYDGLGGFGKFCAVINVLALVANNTPGAYSMGMNLQMIGGMFGKVPRPVFTTLATVIYAACAMGGRDRLYEVFKSFLPLIGYWVMMFVVIVFEEHTIFRRNRGYNWSEWNCRDKLPLGIAAAVAFLIGWAGAIVGMSQGYYIGPIARMAGGAELGLWLGAGFTAIFFPPLRVLELKFVGR